MGAKNSKNSNEIKKENNIKIYTIKKMISIDELTEKEKTLISKIPKINKTYIYSQYSEIPLITFNIFLGQFILL